jgi:hypothetical protein
MITSLNGAERPPIHLLASESDLVGGLALRSEHRQPVVAAMLLEEISVPSCTICKRCLPATPD